MTVRRVSPGEALEMVRNDGYVYLDVRSVPEFEAGHPAGAYNVPLVHMGPLGMTPNPDFLRVVQAAFPPDTRLVLGCRSGGRSLHAAGLLQQAGYVDVVDQRAGFEGGHGERGWKYSGLPVAQAAEGGRSWDELRARA